MREPTFRDKLLYFFDNTLSRGAVGLIGWLAIFSILLIIGISLIVWGAGIAPDTPGFIKVFWMSLMRTLDPGTMGGDEGNWAFLISMLLVTMGGIFVISTLIGVINNTIVEKLEELRKGRSRVIEKDHTVILGWTQEIFTILEELVITNENKQNPCVVILARKDKIEMEDEIREKVGDTRNTRIVCRTGNPLEFNDLLIANLHDSRSVIILSPVEDNPDSEVIKTLLAIINNPDRRKEPYHTVAVVRDPVNLEVAKMVGRDEVELLLEDDVISRIIAQTSRQSGLSVIYKEILDYAGDEIYFKEVPGLKGKTFGEALFLFEDSSLIGVEKKNKTAKLNPPSDTIIEEGDKVICISQNSNTVKINARPNQTIHEDKIDKGGKNEPRTEKTLILGWNSRTVMVIRQLDQYVAPDSLVTVVAEDASAEAKLREDCNGLENQTVDFITGDVTSRKLLEKLKVQEYNHTILLCNLALPPQQADSRMLITLLHLRDIAEHHECEFSIVSEMIDPNNCKLASVAKADDFVVGSELVSFLLTQISENKKLSGVFAEIFDAEGCEIYLKSAENYVKTDEEINFFTVLESARQKNEAAIGYRLTDKHDDPYSTYGVVVNPPKSRTFTLKKGDKIIVVANE